MRAGVRAMSYTTPTPSGSRSGRSKGSSGKKKASDRSIAGLKMKLQQYESRHGVSSPKTAVVHNNLAKAYAIENDSDRSLPHLQKALEIFADNGKVEHVERILDELANAWVQWVGQILATVHAQDADGGGAKKQPPREFPHGRKHGQEVCAIAMLIKEKFNRLPRDRPGVQRALAAADRTHALVTQGLGMLMHAAGDHKEAVVHYQTALHAYASGAGEGLELEHRLHLLRECLRKAHDGVDLVSDVHSVEHDSEATSTRESVRDEELGGQREERGGRGDRDERYMGGDRLDSNYVSSAPSEGKTTTDDNLAQELKRINLEIEDDDAAYASYGAGGAGGCCGGRKDTRNGAERNGNSCLFGWFDASSGDTKKQRQSEFQQRADGVDLL